MNIVSSQNRLGPADLQALYLQRGGGVSFWKESQNLDESYCIIYIVSFLLSLEFAGDEMFTDSYKMKVTDDGIFYEVEGNVSKTEKNNKPNIEIYINDNGHGFVTFLNTKRRVEN